MLFSRSFWYAGCSAIGLFFLGGCEPVLFGTAAMTTSVMAEERGLSGAFSDTDIRARINYLWITNQGDLIDYLSLSVQNGKVVLAGIVPNPKLKIEAVRLVWRVEGVREVVDEIAIGDPDAHADYWRDMWITTKLRLALFGDTEIASRNYSYFTVDKVIYVMGIAQNQKELDRVLDHARNVTNVRNVVDHTQMKKQETPVSKSSPIKNTTPLGGQKAQSKSSGKQNDMPEVLPPSDPYLDSFTS